MTEPTHITMQSALQQAAQSLHAAFARFPEFTEVSLQSVLMEHPTDEGETITTREPMLMARRADGDWLTYEESDDVYAMNNLIDWSRPVRAMVFGATLTRGPIVFERDQMTAEGIEQRLGEGLRHVASRSAGFSVG